MLKKRSLKNNKKRGVLKDEAGGGWETFFFLLGLTVIIVKAVNGNYNNNYLVYRYIINNYLIWPFLQVLQYY